MIFVDAVLVAVPAGVAVALVTALIWWIRTRRPHR